MPGPVTLKRHRTREDELYDDLARTLRDEWAKDKRYRNFDVEITAKQGRRDTGGKWSRPDIVLAGVTTFQYVPGKHLEVTTFEVKPPDGLGITAVYEALAHLRFGTRAYVLAYVPDDQAKSLAELVDQVAEEAKRHGVGFIVAADPADYGCWEERVEGVRHEFDPFRVNEFISRQLSATVREKLVMWSK